MVTYPKDWKRYSFNSFFKLLTNNTLSRDKLSTSGEVGDIHYGDILVKYGSTISSSDDIPRIRADLQFRATDFLQKNDVIIADTAEDETVGKMIQIGSVDFPIVSGLHTVACRPIIKTIDGYLGYYMNSRCWHDQLLPYIVGTKVSSVSKKSLRETELCLPADTSEQQAIVEALTSIDTHIANLTELIEKKKAIRDGALEDLVSGRTRLEGFSGKWHCNPLAKLGTFVKGAPLSKAAISSSGTPLILYGELYTTYGDVIHNVIHRTDVCVEQKYFSVAGDVIIPTSGETAEEIATAACVMQDGVILGGDLMIIKTNKTLVDGRFLSYTINHVVNRAIADIAQGISVIHIKPKEVSRIDVLYPAIDEQRAIADVIEAMDDEITSLETERDKMRQIKAGMMDDLLTGRVRLIG